MVLGLTILAVVLITTLGFTYQIFRDEVVKNPISSEEMTD